MKVKEKTNLAKILNPNLVAICLAYLLCLPAQPSRAQNDEPEPPDQADQQEYISIRIDLWSRALKTIEEDDVDVTLKLGISTALFRYRTLDDLLDPETEHINALGVRSKLEFEYPTSVRNVAFVPELEVALNRSLDTSNRILSAAATVGLLHRRNGDERDIRTKGWLKYGTQYEQDGLNINDYFELGLRVYLKQWNAVPVGKRYLTVTPYGEYKNFLDDLRFVSESGALFNVGEQFEIGLEFNTDPRKKILGIALPRMKIGYVFGDSFKGIRIRI